MKKMKYILSFYAACLLVSNVTFANGIIECNGCSSQQSLAAARNSGELGQVYVMNFPDHLLRKYEVWQERDTQFNRWITMAVPKTVNAAEKNAFDELDLYIDSAKAQVIQDADLYPDTINPLTGQPFGSSFGAYDVIGNFSQGLALFETTTVALEIALSIQEAVEILTSVFEILKLDVQFEVRVTFPDGSIGYAEFVDGIYVFDDSRFIDSDGNRIPWIQSSTNGQTYIFPNRYTDNYSDFIDRLAQMGIPVTYSNSNTVSCSFVCGNGGCTLTCDLQ